MSNNLTKKSEEKKRKWMKKIIKLIEVVHFKIFGHPISDEMKNFLGSLSWSFLGGIISALVIFFINIMAGRILGPSEYGRYSLVIAVASIFVIFMTWGIDTAATYYISRSKNEDERKKYFSSVLTLYLVLIGTVVVMLFIFQGTIAFWFKTTSRLIFWASLFALFSSSKNIADAFIKSQQQFKFQSFLRISEAFIIFVSFIAFIYLSLFKDFSNYIEILIMGYIFFIAITVRHFKKYIGFSFQYVQKLLSYGTFAVVGSFSGILFNSFDKILVNRFLGSSQLGIYNAYSIVSTVLVVQVIAMFINVFFPVLSSIEDKEVIFHKINKLALLLAMPIYFMLILIITLAITLFGKQYPFDLGLVLEFGLLAVLIIYFTILWWLIASQGKEGIKFTSINGIIAGLFFVGLIWVFRNTLSLHLVVAFLMVGMGYAILAGWLGYKYSFWKIK